MKKFLPLIALTALALTGCAASYPAPPLPEPSVVSLDEAQQGTSEDAPVVVDDRTILAISDGGTLDLTGFENTNYLQVKAATGTTFTISAGGDAERLFVAAAGGVETELTETNSLVVTVESEGFYLALGDAGQVEIEGIAE